MNDAPLAGPRLARARIAGLYAITPGDRDTDALLRGVRAALAGGARLLQYRAKHASAGERREQIAGLLPLARAASVPLIVNDDVALAIACGADGAHLGAGDGEVSEARARLGPHRLLGVSCYDRLDLALAAERSGADYVAFGSMFVSATKPAAIRATPALLTEARRRLTIPIVAIGGITAGNAEGLIAAGADALAVISALFDADDIEAAAAEFSILFSRHSHEHEQPSPL